MVVIKRTIRPARNKISAKPSILVARVVLLLIERKESMQLDMKMIMARAAPSSIYEDSDSFDIFTDVNTIKQNPNRFAEVLRI